MYSNKQCCTIFDFNIVMQILFNSKRIVFVLIAHRNLLQEAKTVL